MPEESAQPVELLTARQLARRLQIDIKTLRAMTKEDRIPVIRIAPKIVRYDPVDVLDTIKRNSAAGNFPSVRPHLPKKGGSDA